MQNDVNNFARNAKKNIIASNEKRKIISNAKMKIIDIGYQQCKMNISISLKKTYLSSSTQSNEKSQRLRSKFQVD